MSICKASEIPRNEAYAQGIRYKAQGVWPKIITMGEKSAHCKEPYTCRLLEEAFTIGLP